jgi:hypothetical protein
MDEPERTTPSATLPVTMTFYSEKDLARVRHAFKTACSDLLIAHSAERRGPIDRDRVTECVNALLDALMELEVVEETMRIEGNFSLAPEDVEHIRPVERAIKAPGGSS